MTYEEYVSFIDSRLRSFHAEITAFRYKMDEVTSGEFRDMPESLTPEQAYQLRRAAFAAMNADWDLSSAQRALFAARSRLTRV